MAKATDLAHAIDWHAFERRVLDTARVVLVGACALALIAADRALPF